MEQKKVYLYYNDGDDSYNMVDIETLLGAVVDETDISVNEETKTAQIDSAMFEFETPNLTYNYFQNSNLSAWKLWYSLDNDTSRFTWAGNLKEPLLNTHDSDGFKRNKSKDITISNQKYEGWSYGNDNDILYTLPQELSVINDVEIEIFVNPISNVHLYMKQGANMVDRQDELISVENGETGKGVIYRLIDEWNNDVCYDFKNIQKYAQMDAGDYDKTSLPNTWVYTFSLYNVDDDVYKDGSLEVLEVVEDDTYIYTRNNTILSCFALNGKRFISDNVITGYYSFNDEEALMPSEIYIEDSSYAIIGCNGYGTQVIGFVPKDTVFTTYGIYLHGKKVLMEN